MTMQHVVQEGRWKEVAEWRPEEGQMKARDGTMAGTRASERAELELAEKILSTPYSQLSPLH